MGINRFSSFTPPIDLSYALDLCHYSGFDLKKLYSLFFISAA